MVIIWLIYEILYGYYMVNNGYYMVNIWIIIWLLYGYYMVVIWLMMVSNNLIGGWALALWKILVNYHLVMLTWWNDSDVTIWLFNSLPWKDPPFLIGKPSICMGHGFHGYVK